MKKLEQIHIVYGKKKTEKRFKPFDMKDNKFVVNLIYASIFQDDDKPKLDYEVEYMNTFNKEYIFEIRSQFVDKGE